MAGFTKVDNELLQKLLTSDFTKRQLKILLLIIRFSYGYQKSYAILRKNDFSYAGVSQYCITEELKKLVKKRVIFWNPKNDTVRVNPNLEEWAVERAVNKPVSFFKLATKNSMKQQLSIYQNSKSRVAEMTTPNIDTKKLKKDIERENFFLRALRGYFLRVAPLTESEMLILRQVVESYPPRAVEKAIDAISAGDNRSFAYFLKLLDSFGNRTRSGKLTSLTSGLQRFRKLTPES